METVANVILPFFAVVGCGYLAARRGGIVDAGIAGLNFFVFYFALPSLIFRGLPTRPLGEILVPSYIGAYGLAGMTTFLLAAAAGRWFFRASVGVMAVQGQAASVSNIGYVGVPLIVALLGEEAMAPIVLAMLVDMFLIQAPSMALLEVDRHRGTPPGTLAWKVLRGFVVNPFVVSIAAGTAFSAAGLGLPGAIDSLIRLLGLAAGPAALFALGAALAGRHLTDDFGETLHMTAFKLFVNPVLVWGCMTLVFQVDWSWTRVAVLAAALPIAGNVFVVARNFDVYAAQASTAILVSTLAAVLTFSVLAVSIVS